MMQYIVDEKGTKTHVIVPVGEYETVPTEEYEALVRSAVDLKALLAAVGAMAAVGRGEEEVVAWPQALQEVREGARLRRRDRDSPQRYDVCVARRAVDAAKNGYRGPLFSDWYYAILHLLQSPRESRSNAFATWHVREIRHDDAACWLLRRRLYALVYRIEEPHPRCEDRQPQPKIPHPPEHVAGLVTVLALLDHGGGPPIPPTQR